MTVTGDSAFKEVIKIKKLTVLQMYETTILKGVVGKGADLRDWTQVEPVIHMT